jgi:ribose 5-phosphate isomerase B
MKIALGADHAGFDYKQEALDHLKKSNELKDFGTYSSESADYPDFAHAVAGAVESSEFEYGILFCGSANGVAITANKHQGIRAAVCWSNEIASLARRHNNANIICIPSRFVSEEESLKMIDTFLSTAFEGGRHAKRVEKIAL